MKVSTKQFLGYAILPRIIPMIRDLMKPGFGLVAMSMAQIFGACGILPVTHPYLNSSNTGRYGIAHVILEGFRNLKFQRDHLDQVCIFMLLVSGIAVLVAQFFILGFVIFAGIAHAGLPTTYAGYFVTANPTQDIAYILLDRVFGINSTPAFFNSCVAQPGVVCLTSDPGAVHETWPLPYHRALQEMLAFYSVGLCVIGLVIFMYYAVVVFLETAESGTPFGKRFNHVWAPIRMVVALGLLIPLSYGLNGAQLLTLNVAKWGSSFATNGWLTFVQTMVDAGNNTLLGQDNTMVARPQKPGPANLFQFFTVVSACQKLYETRNDPPIRIDAYLVKKGGGTANRRTMMAETWQSASTFYEGEDIVVVFGELDDGTPASGTTAAVPSKYQNYKGNVMPWCGELILDVTDLVSPGAVSIQEAYWTNIIKGFWDNAHTGAKSGMLAGLPNRNLSAANGGQRQDFFYEAANRSIETAFGRVATGSAMTSVTATAYPDDEPKRDLLQFWSDRIQIYVDAAWAAQVGGTWLNDLRLRGWAGAGIWYNRLAEVNGGFMAAVTNIPTVRKWPLAMEAAAEESAKSNVDVSSKNKFSNTTSKGEELRLPTKIDPQIAEVLSKVYANTWESTTPQDTDATGNGVHPRIVNNIFTAFLEQLFGTKGLYSMAANTDIHPLAQIVIMGKYLMEAAIRNVLSGTGASILERALTADIPKAIASVVAQMGVKIGMMTLAIGFVLYYVVPFLPFLYFFFQVGGWIKGIFEAMVGLPLWALAHIRIDGDGLPGSAAMNGYYLILEIFLRPILTIFGLVGGIAIFSAQVQVLHEIFALVVTNVTGFDQENAQRLNAGVAGWQGYARGYVDQLFYTVIYALIVYMMGVASFKLIYMIPDKTLRWMGANIESFGDEIGKGTPEGLIGKMYGGGVLATGQLSQSVNAIRPQ